MSIDQKIIETMRAMEHMPKAGSKREALLFERLEDEEILQDCATLGLMLEIYCKGHHDESEREEVKSPASLLGAYEGRHTPKLCKSCNAHLIYGETRRALCPYDPKPNCKNCETHCYKPDEQAFQREMMRYVGPRTMLYPHIWKDAFKHIKNTVNTKGGQKAERRGR